jgi:thiol-disulfide isomerase/thioredoxin
MRLYFIHMRGCGACEMAAPELAKFAKAHPEIDIQRIDLLEAKWVHPWQPDATPTYVAESPGRVRVQWQGALKAEQVEQFIERAEEMMGLR